MVVPSNGHADEPKTHLIDPSMMAHQKVKGSVNVRETAIDLESDRGEATIHDSPDSKTAEAVSAESSEITFIRKMSNRMKGVEEEMMDEDDTVMLSCITSPFLMVSLAFIFSTLLAVTTLSICLSLKVRQLKGQLESINKTAEACAARAMIMMDMHQHEENDYLYAISPSTIHDTKSYCPSHSKSNMLSHDSDFSNLQNNFSNLMILSSLSSRMSSCYILFMSLTHHPLTFVPRSHSFCS